MGCPNSFTLLSMSVCLSVVGNEKSEVRSQKSEVRSQKSEVRSQKSDRVTAPVLSCNEQNAWLASWKVGMLEISKVRKINLRTFQPSNLPTLQASGVPPCYPAG